MSYIENEIENMYLVEDEEDMLISNIMENLNDNTMQEILSECMYLDTFRGVIEYYKNRHTLSERQKYVISKFLKEMHDIYTFLNKEE